MFQLSNGTLCGGASNASGEEAFGAVTGINAIRVGQFQILTQNDGSVLLHFAPEAPERLVPAWQVLDRVVEPDDIAVRIVLIGGTVPGLFDLQETPLDRVAVGIEIYAQFL